MTRRAAIYARYSDDELQSPHSIEDQDRICHEHATLLGVEVVAVFSDAGISGKTIARRPGIRQMMAAAERQEFDVVIAEALDRISRGQADTATIFEHLSHHDVEIVTIAEGTVTELQVGFKGATNATFLKDMAAKVRRGQRGQVSRGRAPGGLAYGYRVVRKFGDDGKPISGLREIDPKKAPIVIHIFEQFVAGKSPEQITNALNANGVPGPRGKRWNRSALVGDLRRGRGILRNRLYIGEVTFGRETYKRHPVSGRRTSTVTEKGKWLGVPAPELRIVPDNLWAAAQRLLGDISKAPRSVRRRPRLLLAGLVFCGVCGSRYTIHDRDRMQCSGFAAGTCSNNHRARIQMLEAEVIDDLQHRMLEPDRVAAALAEHQAEIARERKAASDKSVQAKHDLRETEKKIERLVLAIAEGGDFPAMRAMLGDLERRRLALAQTLEAATAEQPTVIDITPALNQTFARRIGALAEQLADPATRDPAFRALRRLISAVTLFPYAGGLEMECSGALYEVIAIATGRPLPSSADVPNLGVLLASPRGFEPLFPP